MTKNASPVVNNPWSALRQFTDARIALGRAGVSLPTHAHLEFQLAHANARDAVHLALDAETMARKIDASIPHAGAPCMVLQSAAASRAQYLQRPDYGRKLNAESRACLQALRVTQKLQPDDRPYDLALVVVDGLSALAMEQNALPFINALLPLLAEEDWKLAPVSVVIQGRVAVGDEVGQLLGAKLVVVLIGERPGLSSPDSMGLYMTWMPAVGLTDAARNCISNVRPAGVPYDEAAYKLHYLLSNARKRALSGVALKDETVGADAQLSGSLRNFLVLPP
jgi:ethanolamine ammonia-lyase small subunit